MLLPGPVELPCRPGHTGPLCNRDIALRDVRMHSAQPEGEDVAEAIPAAEAESP